MTNSPTIANLQNFQVPPRHPIARLNRLVEFSEELIDTWFAFLPSQENWKLKFARNGERMEFNFKRGNQRCGYYDDSLTQFDENGNRVSHRKF